ncbi:hypothetical protein GGI05_007369 [Coemansia sp. RSA 2603]|nr:hypothetical protein GGI05_007369 [Coemansia sp. RSA 2603]
MEISQVTEEIDAVLDHRVVDDKIEYLLQWSSDGNKTWESDKNLVDCSQLLSIYWNTFIQKTPNHSYVIPQIVETQQPAADNTEQKTRKRAKSIGTKKKQLVRRATSKPAPEDKIAVAKRVQMNKQLSGARGRVAATVSKAARASPARAKRVKGVESSDEEEIDLSPDSSKTTKVVQRARKSTGRRAPPLDLDVLRSNLPAENQPESSSNMED